MKFGQLATMNFVRRKFRGKLCAYCSTAKSKTDDHIFAGKFFLEKDRGDLPKVPCCRPCNGKKAELEHYLISVLGFGGRHEQAVENLLTGIPRRLEKNIKLQRKLMASMEPAWLRQGSGLYQPTSVIDFDGSKLEALLKYIGRGLAWHHWGVYLRPEDCVSVAIPIDLGSAVLQSFINPRNFPVRVTNDLGNGTVIYEGMQGTEPATLTVWRIVMYGGVVLSSNQTPAGRDAQTSSQWWVFTGPPELGATIDRLKR